MSDIQDTGPITPREKKMYEQEFRHGADLFQRALNQYEQSVSNPFQREQFGEVMDRAMQVLNETARELKRKDLMDKTEQLALDYQAYQDNPTEKTKGQLVQDLDAARKAVGK